ncbi:MAG: hypothetical protein ACREJ0_25830, partial [Geminicoccaceae bacterium]
MTLSSDTVDSGSGHQRQNDGKLMTPYRIYQKVVAEMAASLNPGAEVREGQWIIGPDGRRDLDVVIYGAHT